MSLAHHIRALGKEDLPQRIVVDGRTYRRRELFKHDSVAAVGFYECEGDRVVLKSYRRAPLFGLPTAWAGRLMAAHEAAVMQQLEGIERVPRLRAWLGRTAIVRDYVPGEPLTDRSKVGPQFFAEFFELLGKFHARGVAYVDLEKAANILLTPDGHPCLFDFQVAFFVPDHCLGRTRLVSAVRELLQEVDVYHARKHRRRLVGERLSEEEVAQSRRRPWLVAVANALDRPFKKLRRWLRGKGS